MYCAEENEKICYECKAIGFWLVSSIPHVWGGSKQILLHILLNPFLCLMFVCAGLAGCMILGGEWFGKYCVRLEFWKMDFMCA